MERKRGGGVMKPDWKGFCEYVIKTDGNINVSKAKQFNIPEGNYIELMIFAANNPKTFVANARKALDYYERK